MARLTKKEVLKAGLRTAEFEVPEWGGSILLGEWPVGRTQEMMDLFQGANPDQASRDPNMLVKLFIMGCVDPVFTEADIPELLETSGAVIVRASQRIMEINGLTQAAQDAARGKS
jgi:hypothetical protein